MARVGDIVSAPGSRPYELLLEIGSGGMARVFLGRAVGAGGFERLVAVKVCREDLATDPLFRSMFLDEARLAARIHHPHVVPTLDVGEGAVLYLVMEYIEGERLSRLQKEAGLRATQVPVTIALRVLLDALAGLHAAHASTDAEGNNLGIVHRDASAQNLIVGLDGVTRILDFGIARALSQSTTTKEGQIKGKLGYMPPEYLNAREVGAFTDVYGIGVVAWELLAGQRLFLGETEGQTLTAIMRGQVPPLRDARPDVPEAVDAVIRRALARDPQRRYRTALEFAVALEGTGVPAAGARAVGEYTRGLVGPELAKRRQMARAPARPLEAPPTAPVTDAGDEPFDLYPRRRWNARLMVAALVAGALVLGLWLWRPRDGATDAADDGSGNALNQPSPTAAAPSPSVATEQRPAAPGPAAADGGPAVTPDAGPGLDPVAAQKAAGRRTNRVRSRPRRAPRKASPSEEWSPDDI